MRRESRRPLAAGWHWFFAATTSLALAAGTLPGCGDKTSDEAETSAAADVVTDGGGTSDVEVDVADASQPADVPAPADVPGQPDVPPIEDQAGPVDADSPDEFDASKPDASESDAGLADAGEPDAGNPLVALCNPCKVNAECAPSGACVDWAARDSSAA